MLTIGDTFPEYSLEACVALEPAKAFATITQDSYLGMWQVVFAWPKDFTFVCPTEVAAFAGLNSAFEDRGAQVLGFSVDSEFVHHAWRRSTAELQDVPFPMMSDVGRKLSAALGLLTNEGVAQRATYIIDPANVIQFAMVTSDSVGRNVNEVLRILDALQTDGLCPCNWNKGDDTLDATSLLEAG